MYITSVIIAQLTCKVEPQDLRLWHHHGCSGHELLFTVIIYIIGRIKLCIKFNVWIKIILYLYFNHGYIVPGSWHMYMHFYPHLIIYIVPEDIVIGCIVRPSICLSVHMSVRPSDVTVISQKELPVASPNLCQ